MEEIVRSAPRSAGGAQGAPPDLGGLLAGLLRGPPIAATSGTGGGAAAPAGDGGGGLANILQMADQLFGPATGAPYKAFFATSKHFCANSCLLHS